MLRGVYLPSACSSQLAWAFMTAQGVLHEPIDSVLRHFPICLAQRLQGELFAVCARDRVVQQSILAWVFGLCLLQLLHEIGRVGGTFLVSRVQSTSDNPLDYVESYCSRSAYVLSIGGRMCGTHANML